eukprot:CAMPEP_0117434850 /NCGR_PEP_ID=MMETSP0759-20121206/166_1 /TAXON_ID=63605 /ORGANISM="Percolomonas cosmopolitus, Strain WS" /LENGTH=307 /DNA_ID=CAMNT_0005226355 /DNA_START=283 /DNA_END=1206 /DNA_ORIENTATION=-
MSDALANLTEDFSLEYDPSDQMRTHIAQIHQLATQFQKSAVEEFDSVIQNRSVGQVKNFATSLDGASKSIESRDKSKYSFDNSRYKVVQMLESKKPVDQIKFKSAQQELATDTATYNSAAFQCKKELYELTHARAHNPSLSALCDALAQLSQNMNHNFAQLSNLSQQINQVGVYQARYPENRETVRPAELSLTPSVGFATTYHPPSGGSGAPPMHQSGGQSQAYYPPSSGSSPAPTSSSSVYVPTEFDSEWYYLDANVQQQGPIAYGELKNLFRSNQVTASTHVFGGTLTDWAPLGTVKGLMGALAK